MRMLVADGKPKIVSKLWREQSVNQDAFYERTEVSDLIDPEASKSDYVYVYVYVYADARLNGFSLIG